MIRLKPTRFEKIEPTRVPAAISAPPASPAPGPEPALPSTGRVIFNALGAAGRNVRAALAGEVLEVPADEAQRRLAICQTCEFFRASDERCSHASCGCFMRLKTTLKAEHCPARKW